MLVCLWNNFGLTIKEKYTKNAIILLPFARSDFSYACTM